MNGLARSVGMGGNRAAAALVAIAVFVAATKGVSFGGIAAQQIMALGVGGILVLLPTRETPPGAPVRLIAGGAMVALVGWYVALFTLDAILDANVDWLQALRDLRDLVVTLAIGGLFYRAARGRGAALLGGLAIGGGALSIVELLLRNRSTYSMLFNPDFLGYRVQAGFYGPNEYAAYLSVIAAAAVGLALASRSRWKTLGAVAIVLACVVALIRTFSRGGVLGLCVGVFAAMYWSQRRAWLVGGAVVVVGVVLSLTFSGARSVGAEGSTGSVLAIALGRLTSGDLSSGVSDRSRLIRAAGLVGARTGGLGGGLGAFPARNQAEGGTGTLSPHNEVVKAFADGGVIAAGLTGLVYLGVLLAALRTPDGLRPAATGAVTAAIIAEQFFAYLVRPGFSVLAAALAGIVLASASAQSHRGEPAVAVQR